MTREVLCYATLGTYAFLRRQTGTVVFPIQEKELEYSVHYSFRVCVSMASIKISMSLRKTLEGILFFYKRK